jgi:hypothetical protein
MILTLLFYDRVVTAGCPDNGLVFNGSDWIKPEVGGKATLIFVQKTSVGQLAYPVHEQSGPGSYSQQTKYVCRILEVNPGSAEPGVVSHDDPLGGGCLCLVCNQGTQLLNVKVTQ